jgi:Heavy metal binding domain
MRRRDRPPRSRRSRRSTCIRSGLWSAIIEEGRMVEATRSGTSRRSPAVPCKRWPVACRYSRTAVGVIAVALVGCATGSALRPLDPSHPASPAAAEAPPAEPATMLRESSQPGDVAPAEQSHAGHKMHKSAHHSDARVEYTCPMHREVHESRPGRCPKCGMALVKTAGDGSSEGLP